MPRSKSYSRDKLIEDAMVWFWRHGFSATSMDELVGVTGVSRHGIYASFGGKRNLYLACLDAYQDAVVTPAFAAVESEGADLAVIEGYFETQIAKAEGLGLPGPGCLVANTMTELGPHDAGMLAKVTAHHDRLRRGFANALRGEAGGSSTTDQSIEDCADLLVTAAQGLWSFSRSVSAAEPLRRTVATLVDLIKTRLTS